MSQVLAIVQNDPTLMPVQVARVDGAVDLGLVPGKAGGVGTFVDDRVLLRKKPVGAKGLSLVQLAGDLNTHVLLAAAHRNVTSTFREEDTAPYRFRNWLFAGTGRIVPLGEREKLLADLPEFLQRGIGGPSDSEVAFLATLAHLHRSTRQLDNPDVDPSALVASLKFTVELLDHRARDAGVAAAETTALLTNGRVLGALRRGRPLSYALVEGVPDPALPVHDDARAAARDPAVKRMKSLRAVVITSRPRPAAGIAWIEVPDRHVLTVSRDLGVRVTGL